MCGSAVAIAEMSSTVSPVLAWVCGVLLFSSCLVLFSVVGNLLALSQFC